MARCGSSVLRSVEWINTCSPAVLDSSYDRCLPAEDIRLVLGAVQFESQLFDKNFMLFSCGSAVMASWLRGAHLLGAI